MLFWICASVQWLVLSGQQPPVLFITVHARQHCIEIPPLFSHFLFLIFLPEVIQPEPFNIQENLGIYLLPI